MRTPAAASDKHVRRLAHVIPFRGLRYNRESIADLSRVVSPPYDIISPAQQEQYLNRHPANAIHLDFNKEEPGDDDHNNRYTRAADTFDRWLEQKILIPEARPALYLLREEFTGPDGERAVRQGFIADVKLAEFSEGIVLPHEETASGPKEDRLRLMESTEANLSAIFCLYSDPEHQVAAALEEAAAADPDIDITDDAGTRHSLWVIEDAAACESVTAFLSDKKLYIADGHHRYETALTYRYRRRQREDPGPGEQPYDYMMIYLSNMEDSSPSILPIHRLVYGLEPRTLADITGLLEGEFQIEDIPPEPEAGRQMMQRVAAAGEERNAFGLYLPDAGEYKLLVARRPRPLLDAGTGHSAAWRSLEVSALDKLILADLLGISTGGANSGASVRYVERTGNALREAENADAAFFVNPTSMAEIKAVAEAGEKMPQKSTYFYPKPLTGLVFRSFRF